jgi:hypothetical protein
MHSSTGGEYYIGATSAAASTSNAADTDDYDDFDASAFVRRMLGTAPSSTDKERTVNGNGQQPDYIADWDRQLTSMGNAGSCARRPVRVSASA